MCPVTHEQERDAGEWAKAYLDFFDLGLPLRLTKTNKKFSETAASFRSHNQPMSLPSRALQQNIVDPMSLEAGHG
jgi:hypothetical protein